MPEVANRVLRFRPSSEKIMPAVRSFARGSARTSQYRLPVYVRLAAILKLPGAGANTPALF